MKPLDPKSSPSAIVAKVNEIIGLVNKKKRFTPPTPQEVVVYAQEYAREHPGVDGNIDGHKFCDFYASKDWKIGKAKMKDWEATVRRAVRDGWCKKIEKDRVLDQKKLKAKAYDKGKQVEQRYLYGKMIQEASVEKLRDMWDTKKYLQWLIQELRPELFKENKD